MPVMPGKDEIASLLATAHRDIDPSIVRVVRIASPEEDDPNEPVKLLEVNPNTSPSGIVPIVFGADSPTVPFPSIVVEVTEEEFHQIESENLSLPHGWRLTETIYPAS